LREGGRGDRLSGQSTLEYLEHGNLFIVPLDHEQHWYRYHPLFADVLKARLRGQLAPDEIAGLHRRASHWYWKNRAPAEAVEHAFAAPDFEQAAQILEATAKSSMMQGNLSTLLRWIDRLPPEWLKARLRLRVYQAWALFLGGQANLSRQFLSEARGDLLSQPASPDLRALRGELASMLAIISTSDRDPATIMELVQEAQEYLPESDLTSRARATHVLGTLHNVLGDTRQSIPVFEQALQLALAAHNSFLASSILETIASTHIHCGRLRQAARVFQELVDLGSQGTAAPRPFAGNGYLGLAEVLLEQNRLEEAARFTQQGMGLIRQGGIGYNLLSAWCVQARFCMARTDPAGALEALYQAEQVSILAHSSPWTVYLAAYEVRWHLAQGDIHQARQWAFHLPGIGPESLPLVVREVHRVTQARVHLALGEPQSVLTIATEELSAVEAAGRMARVIEFNLLKALALEALGDSSSAVDALEIALDLAEPEGYVRLFLEAGPAARRLLEAARPNAAPARLAYIDRLLAGFAPPVVPPAEKLPGPDPITERERDVLRLLAAGYSNQEIAAQLVLTLNTVKKHTSNLYAKLGVTSRTQAIARARELGIL
jgi:LuxR family maltose regulon positive regulatory protein